MTISTRPAKKSVGLSQVIAADTAICTVGRGGGSESLAIISKLYQR